MKRARFTDEQIVRILQEADKSPVVEVAKRMNPVERHLHRNCANSISSARKGMCGIAQLRQVCRMKLINSGA